MSLSQAQVVPRPANKGLQQSTSRWEPCLHRHGPHRVSDRATRADFSNLWHAVRLAEEMKGCALNTVCATNVVVGRATENG
jgi:hypothetical protein